MYALAMVDHFTRWPVVYPVVYPVAFIEAEVVAEEVQEFIHTYDCVEELLSNRGSNFTSKLVRELCKKLGVNKIYTCSFRPSANGLTEHLNGTLFEGVRMYASQKPSTWDAYFDALMFAYKNTPHSVTQHTPGFLTFGPLDMKHLTCSYTEDPLKVMQNERQQAYAIVKDLVAKKQKRQIK